MILSEAQTIFNLFENAGQRTEVDVVVMKFIKEMQHRSFSSELVEGWRRRWRMRPAE
jgi:hypothetical protein